MLRSLYVSWVREAVSQGSIPPGGEAQRAFPVACDQGGKPATRTTGMWGQNAGGPGARLVAMLAGKRLVLVPCVFYRVGIM